MDLAHLKIVTGIVADGVSIIVGLVTLWNLRKFFAHVAAQTAKDIKKL